MNSGLNFGSAVDPYYNFRPSYPERLFKLIIRATPKNMRTLAMDLGAGTGLSTLPLCRWFNQVIAVEPDIRMAVNLSKLNNKIKVRHTTAEECMQELSSVDLITSGNAFYWMDGRTVIANVISWLRPNGVLAIYRYSFPKVPSNIQALLNMELKLHWDFFRHSRLLDEQYSERCIRASEELTDIRVFAVPNIVFLNSKQLTGFFKSTSYVSTYLQTVEDADSY